MQCYYCGDEEVSKEHVPPQQLFKDFSGARVKVPSCEKHNTDKSGLDRLIIRSLLMSADLHPNRHLFSDNVLYAINNVKTLFYEDKPIVQGHILDENKKTITNVSYVIGMQHSDLEQWIKQITAALVNRAIGRYEPTIIWNNSEIFTPLIPSTSVNIPNNSFISAKKIYEDFVSITEPLDWRQGWCSNGKYAEYPHDLYDLDVYIGQDFVIFRHTFLMIYNFFLKIAFPDEIKRILFEKSGPQTKRTNP